jgi:hypothetical protein
MTATIQLYLKEKMSTRSIYLPPGDSPVMAIKRKEIIDVMVKDYMRFYDYGFVVFQSRMNKK